MDEIKRTSETYARIAADYAAATQEREELHREVERFVGLLAPGSLVFDVGCGPGFDTAVLRQHNLRVIGLDYSWYMMQAGRKQYQIDAHFAQVDMRYLPLTQCAAGLWLCASFLHIPRRDAAATLRGFARVLVSGGILHLAVKQGQGEEWTEISHHGRQAPRFFTYWQPEALDSLLSAAGFSVVDGWTNVAGKTNWLVRFARK